MDYHRDENLIAEDFGASVSEGFSSDQYAEKYLAELHSEDLLNIIGQSSAIKHIRQLISIHGKYDAPVLITGETGTGKELAARGLHYMGARAGKPFVAINCATLTDDLFASEVFGHVKGSFTDAKKDKKGLLALADKGTLFLDEVDSLSPKSQAALLRFLQENEYRPVGSEQTFKANVRLIASANCDLEERIEQGLFRADLYYRLYILTIHMPALKDRIDDLPVLTDYFIQQLDYKYQLGIKQLSPEFMEELSQHTWPGNVRELENMIHRLYLCSQTNKISSQFGNFSKNSIVKADNHKKAFVDSLRTSINSQEGNYDFSRDKRSAVEVFEREYVTQVMYEAQGNVTLAAKMCGKERRAFGKLVKKYNIKKSSVSCEEF